MANKPDKPGMKFGRGGWLPKPDPRWEPFINAWAPRIWLGAFIAGIIWWIIGK